VAVAADLSKYLDKAYEDKTLEEVLAAPVSALAGVTDADGELLQKALNIKTVGDLGREQVLHLGTRPGRLEQLTPHQHCPSPPHRSRD